MDTQTDVAQRGSHGDHHADTHGHIDQYRLDDVGQQVPEHDAELGAVDGFRSFQIFLGAFLQDLAADQTDTNRHFANCTEPGRY